MIDWDGQDGRDGCFIPHLGHTTLELKIKCHDLRHCQRMRHLESKVATKDRS